MNEVRLPDLVLYGPLRRICEDELATNYFAEDLTLPEYEAMIDQMQFLRYQVGTYEWVIKFGHELHLHSPIKVTGLASAVERTSEEPTHHLFERFGVVALCNGKRLGGATFDEVLKLIHSFHGITN